MSKYKDKEGRYLTRALFFEESSPEMRKVYPCPFTLKEEDKKPYKSMRKIYLSYEDPTEYTFAMEVLGSWDHWKKLCDCNWFPIDQWREELEIKLRSKGISTMADLAVNDKNKDAAKWLAQGGWKVSASNRGRPSKEEVEGEKKKQARLRSEVAEDAARLGITIVKND